ncbi:glycosyl hydrolase catalytic core-domain-containing protein [Cantharellus anzutake]|uniref:glycosyl hydrolase catalytic core-domain-containing protein n=1 Tax=Cantharellus anzutake TaxID=1750568 RepID=UPI0019063B89|nr:glycosyl hydrolase catalytic core-domain-containing protein [Cantharellus anzutake]KAF8326531.1 glycosyl hydrolase catalytic core-domain-containing protein [Cantharellus anzutake]
MAVLSHLITVIALFTATFLSSAPGSANALSVDTHGNLRVRGHGQLHHDHGVRLAEKDYEQGLDRRTSAGKRRRCKKRPITSTTSMSQITSTSEMHSTTPRPQPVGPTTSTPTATSTYTPQPPANGNKKVGLAWAGNDDKLLKYFVTDKTQYVYTWSASCPDHYETTGLNCARMLWSHKNLEDFKNLRQSPGTNTLMGMNEVNIPSQANLSPKNASDLWNQEIRWLGKHGYTLVSPSCTCQENAIQWFQDFFAACGGNENCGVDYLAIHCYLTSTADFMYWVERFWNTFHIKLWVSEWACAGFGPGGYGKCSGDVWKFVTTMVDFLDKTDYVAAHFPFGFLPSLYNVDPGDKLIDDKGYPNALGSYILNH